jgi:exo-1,4-beta-D-glucosaminidase
MTYEGERAMFEAYARNRFRSTGVIQWMLNNAWPSTFWHLYDYYLRPGGGYYGSKKALEPVHVQYSYDDGSIVVVNGTAERLPGVRVRERVLNLDGSQRFSQDTSLDLAAATALRALATPTIPGLSSTYFVDLELTGPDGRSLSSNRYWLSTHPDVLDEDSTTWYVTPVQRYADLTALRTLPTARVAASAGFTARGDWEEARVRVTNPGPTVAFLLRLELLRQRDGEEVLPVLWEDNYLTLLPGESREITGRVLRKDLKGQRPEVRVTGWNAMNVTASPEER